MASMLTGSEAWWRAQNGPQIVREGKRCRVTFLWRDPAGVQSQVRRVWIYITGVTDHHQNAVPQTLQRVPGTDVWQWQTWLAADWRGSYCFIPSEQDGDFAPGVFIDGAPDRTALREGWRKLLPRALADPLNAQSWKGGRGHPVSALEMPDAPVQPGWHSPAAQWPSPELLRWHSDRLGNERRVWVFSSGEDNGADRPLVILLDGQFWAESMPIWPALTTLTHEGQLPAAVYVLIDVIDTARRSVELPCNPDFWQAVQDELLPQVHALAPFSERADKTVVAGQSFGGLSSLYAALHWPQRFGCVLSQSGSYWWPQRGGQQPGALVQAIARGALKPEGLKLVLEAGVREPIIMRVNLALCEALHQVGQTVEWRPVEGGHDALCWRGGLTSGLISLLQPQS